MKTLELMTMAWPSRIPRETRDPMVSRALVEATAVRSQTADIFDRRQNHVPIWKQWMQTPYNRPSRTADELVDAADLRAAITEALNAEPVDEDALRRAVWTFVGNERHAGTTPGHVIIALTELMTAAQIASLAERQAATRRVILWCVEAYFGHLGGDVHDARSSGLIDAPLAPPSG